MNARKGLVTLQKGHNPRNAYHYKQEITCWVHGKDKFFFIPGMGICKVLPLTLDKGCRGLKVCLLLFLLLDLHGC